MSTHTETTLHSETLYSGRIIRLRRDQVRLENGRTTTREVVEHNGGIAVAALTDRDELLMVRQLRYPYGKELLEIPAGKREGNEDTLLGGQRELREETGAVGRDYRFLGEIYPAPRSSGCTRAGWTPSATMRRIRTSFWMWRGFRWTSPSRWCCAARFRTPKRRLPC